ncbi:hypothetical protein M8494_08660 [Serratia ureilytica]
MPDSAMGRWGDAPLHERYRHRPHAGQSQRLCAADARQAAEIVRYVIAQPGPAYIRMDSDKLPVLNASYHFRPGEPEVLHQDLTAWCFAWDGGA